MKTQDLIIGRTYNIRYSLNQGSYSNKKVLYDGIGTLLKLRDGWGARLHEFRLTEDSNGTYPSGPTVYCTSNGIISERGSSIKIANKPAVVDLIHGWEIVAKEIIENELLYDSVKSTVSMLNGLGVGAKLDDGKIVIKPVDAIKMGEILKPVFLHYSQDLLGD